MDMIDTVLTILLVVMGAIIMGVITFIILVLRNYKHKLIIKSMTSGKQVKWVDKAWEKMDKTTGINYWVLLKSKHKIARPPSESLHIDNKGNFIASAYYMGDVNYVYSADKDQDVQKRLQQLGKEKGSKFYKQFAQAFHKAINRRQPIYLFDKDFQTPKEFKNEEVIRNFKPITTNQRMIAHDQIKKALEKKNSGFWQAMPTIVAVAALIVLISIVFIFGGEIIKPLNELGQQLGSYQQSAVKITEAQASITAQLAALIQHEQYIATDTGDNLNRENRTAPN